MKKQILFFVLIILMINTMQSQNLSSEISQIKSDYDLMGGSVVVFCESGILENISFGYADYNRAISVNESTYYRIASISKTITAMAVMMLVDDGAINLDDNIENILGFSVRNPNYPETPISVRMLLSHTSSLIDGNTYSNFLTATYSNNPMPALSEILTSGGSYYSTSNFVNRQPGSYFSYANINYGILASIIEIVSESRFDIYCRENIFEVLDLDASFNVNDLSDIDNLAVLYRKNFGVWSAQADNYSGTQPNHTNLNGYTPGQNGFRFAPQGGLRISGRDLAKIFMLILNKGNIDGIDLLSEQGINAMTNPEWTFNGSNGNNYYGLFRSWGLGVHITTNTLGNDIVLPQSSTMFGHPGEAYGLVSDAYVDFERKLGFIFITNGCGVGYSTNSQSAFYTVETDVFIAIEQHTDFGLCDGVDNDLAFKGSLNIFPNPCSEYIIIDSEELQGGLEIKIFDISGNLVLRSPVIDFRSRIDISFLPNSVYFVEYAGKTEKIVIIR